ncbi:ThuA domain-containing protein [Sphingomonas piscis]|uniref:ThuA domain-containing protein n=1 Tax=Sphingomonas piscis TaxID=2714943 RepID=A0A6G7YNG4_9SPHN|nr:ThuA domain-containing protein [Sphingomonas piscis]QIK78279.1 ThuA domain-containing protein [Sphingomonas piscis]
MLKSGWARTIVLSVAAAVMASAPAQAARKQVLIFSKTTGYRHASIEAGVAALKQLGTREKIDMTATEDDSVFTDASLKKYDAIILLSNTTDPKKPESEWFQGDKRTAFVNFVQRGGGILGIHAATDSHYHWPWYQKMIGGHFARHPQGTPTGTIHVEAKDHPSTARMPTSITRADEWYYFDDYNPTMKLLVTVDPQSIGQTDVNPNPVSWAHTYEGGRVFYTAMGHTNESYSEPNFLNHVAGGLKWVLKTK